MTVKTFENEKEWRGYMVDEMRELKSDIKDLNAKQTEMLITVTTLKVKIGLISAICGTVFGGLVSLVVVVLTKKSGA